jgi:hypothetical protein
LSEASDVPIVFVQVRSDPEFVAARENRLSFLKSPGTAGGLAFMSEKRPEAGEIDQ